MADDDLKTLKPGALETRIRNALESRGPDRDLLDALERLAVHPSFSGFTPLWGPALYQRNRVLFRPFVLNHFSSIMILPPRRWKGIPWKGDIGRALDAWLEVADRENDVPLFRSLYTWKWFSGRRARDAREEIRRDLVARFGVAATPARRQMVLDKFRDLATLDEPAALALYRADPRTSAAWIVRHLPGPFLMKERRLWADLMQAARDRGDEDLYYRLYRRQVPHRQWLADVMALCDRIGPADELCAALERHHLEDYRQNLADAFYGMLEKRGKDVFPYVIRHITQVWRRFLFGGGFDNLIDLADERGWPDLWAGLMRVSAPPARYNREVKRLLLLEPDRRDEAVGRLLLLAGVSREFNFPGLGLLQLKLLDDDVAVLMHERFPELLQGPFKAQITVTWRQHYPKLLTRLIERDDEELIDFLASRMVTRGGSQAEKPFLESVERLADYYQGFRDDTARFSARAGRVLGQIPAYAIYSYDMLIKSNRLARMFFERSAAQSLADPDGVADLLEASEIHVMALAYRVLGLDIPEARAQAPAHLDILLGTLLRPLHRRTRMLAFGALFNAADNPERAGRVMKKAREALDLPDKRYPKEQLVGLIGRLIHRWPELRSEGERPVVYGEAAS